MHIASEDWIQLKHRQRRRLISKWRKSWRRKAAAEERDKAQAVLESHPQYLERLAEEELRYEEQERRREARSRLEEEAWQARERTAQHEHRTRVEKEERVRREREERERVIKEEWEALQKREREDQERRDQARREKEERLMEALSTGDKPTHDPWHNPPAPDSSGHTPRRDYGTERDARNCSFFLKTGACRFGDRCSKQHPRVSSSTTLMVPAMYQDVRLQEILLEERGQDAELEYDDGERYQHFKQFFDDTLPEFTKAGKVVQFKVSCNYEAHLRGNVYVQYSSEEECNKAYQMFNGRWYAQKQLSCEFCPVERWKTAICGLYANMKRCPKGKHCNFLHVFRNPGGAFSRADRDMPPSPPSHSSHSSPPSQQHRRQSSSSSSRSFASGWRHRRDSRHRSKSRERYSERSRRFSRSRSRSKERQSRLSASKSPKRRRKQDSSRSRSKSPLRRRHHRTEHQSRSRSRSPERHKRGYRLRSSSRGEEGNSSGERKQSSRKKHGKKKRSRSRNRDAFSSSSSSKKHKHKKRKKAHRKSARDKEQSHSELDEEAASPKAVDMDTQGGRDEAIDSLKDNSMRQSEAAASENTSTILEASSPKAILTETAKANSLQNELQTKTNSSVCANTLEQRSSQEDPTKPVDSATDVPATGNEEGTIEGAACESANSSSLAERHCGSKQDGSVCMGSVGSDPAGP